MVNFQIVSKFKLLSSATIAVIFACLTYFNNFASAELPKNNTLGEETQYPKGFNFNALTEEQKKSLAMVEGIAKKIRDKHKEMPFSSAVISVVKHLKSDQGIAFDKVEIVLPTIPAAPVLSEEEIYERELLRIEAVDTLPNIPDCKKNRTIKIPFDDPVPESEDGIIVDTLFAPSELIPNDLKEAFGEEIKVRPFTGKPDNESLSYKAVNIPCFPFRVRITKNYIIREEGENAVKDYSEGPYTKGKMSKIMRLKLQDYKK